MILNADKCQHMCLGKDTENEKFYFDGNTYVNSKEKKIDIIIGNALLLNSRIKELFEKTFPKTSSVIWLGRLFRAGTKKLIFNYMIRVHFTYCPLVWMFCSRTSNKLITKSHQCSLILVL